MKKKNNFSNIYYKLLSNKFNRWKAIKGSIVLIVIHLKYA